MAANTTTPPAGARDAVTDEIVAECGEAYFFVKGMSWDQKSMRAAIEYALTGKADGEHRHWGNIPELDEDEPQPAATGAGEGESLESQVDRLANFIIQNIPGEPSQSQGAIDTAIRLLNPVAAMSDALSGQEAMLAWAVNQWHDQVANRPLVNVHRRSLDDVWRQVIRHCGADDVVLIGPRHDQLLAESQESKS